MKRKENGVERVGDEDEERLRRIFIDEREKMLNKIKVDEKEIVEDNERIERKEWGEDEEVWELNGGVIVRESEIRIEKIERRRLGDIKKIEMRGELRNVEKEEVKELIKKGKVRESKEDNEGEDEGNIVEWNDCLFNKIW